MFWFRANRTDTLFKSDIGKTDRKVSEKNKDKKRQNIFISKCESLHQAIKIFKINREMMSDFKKFISKLHFIYNELHPENIDNHILYSHKIEVTTEYVKDSFLYQFTMFYLCLSNEFQDELFFQRPKDTRKLLKIILRQYYFMQDRPRIQVNLIRYGLQWMKWILAYLRHKIGLLPLEMAFENVFNKLRNDISISLSIWISRKKPCYLCGKPFENENIKEIHIQPNAIYHSRCVNFFHLIQDSNNELTETNCYNISSIVLKHKNHIKRYLKKRVIRSFKCERKECIFCQKLKMENHFNEKNIEFYNKNKNKKQ